jgi:hypothetical protein
MQENRDGYIRILHLCLYIKVLHQIKDGTNLFCVAKLSISAVIKYTRVKHILVLTLAIIIDVLFRCVPPVPSISTKQYDHQMDIQEHICQH